MAYSEFALTHGGIGLYSQVVKGMLASGWSNLADSFTRVDWSSQPVVQRDTLPIEVDLTGIALPYSFELPVMFISDDTEMKDYTTAVVEGVDYTIDRNLGTVTILAAGAWDNGVGFGTGDFTILQGYSISRGWMILESAGASGTEQIRIGFRFNTAADNAWNPFLSGVEVSLWTTAPTAVQEFGDSLPSTQRSDPSHDIKCFIDPQADWTGAWSLTADRVIFHGRSKGFTSWFCAGAFARFRPLSEQALPLGSIGSTPTLVDRAGGPVGKTNEPGNLGSVTNMGSVYRFDTSMFAAPGDDIDLNANYWSQEVGHPTSGHTSSRRVTAAGSGASLPDVYFEIHNVICGSSNDLPNDSSNILYGLWEGLFAVLCYEPEHNLSVSQQGVVYRIWEVGGGPGRFIAVEEM